MRGVKNLKNKVLKCEDLEVYGREILELLIDVYKTNFDFPREKCVSICKEKLEKLYTYIKDGSAIIVGFFIDEQLLGIIWLYKKEVYNELYLHVNQLVVKSEYRGKGIGKELILEAEKLAKLFNAKYLELYVIEENKSALGLYNNMGFETKKRYMIKKL